MNKESLPWRSQDFFNLSVKMDDPASQLLVGMFKHKGSFEQDTSGVWSIRQDANILYVQEMLAIRNIQR